MPNITIILSVCTILVLVVASILSSAVFFLMTKAPMDEMMPWSIYQAVYYHWGTPEQFFISLTVGFIIPIVALALLFKKPEEKLYGDARWATLAEIKKTGMLEEKGVVLGSIGSHWVSENNPGHFLVCAPTRSGKGVGLVIPNLLNWGASSIVLDIKRENFEITSGFRKSVGQKVFMFSPVDENGMSHRFNPLDTVRRDETHKISDLQELAAILLPISHSSEAMWMNEARDLFIGLALYVIDNPFIPASIGQINRILKGDKELHKTLEGIIEINDDLHPSARNAFLNFIGKAEKERSGVKSTLTSTLTLWNNPVIDAVTETSDFSFDRLRAERTTIYISVSINQLQSLAPLLNLFIQQAVNVLSRKLPDAKNPYEVLMLLDEFASLGKMDVIAKNMAFLAGYNVRIMNIIQGLGQLENLYGRNGMEGFLQNSHIQVFFASNDAMTSKHVSDALGTKTISKVSKSRQKGRGAGVSISDDKRVMLLPEEVRLFPKDKLIILKEGSLPIQAKKFRYFNDKEWVWRIKSPVSVPKLNIAVSTADMEDQAA